MNYMGMGYLRRKLALFELVLIKDTAIMPWTTETTHEVLLCLTMCVICTGL